MLENHLLVYFNLVSVPPVRSNGDGPSSINVALQRSAARHESENVDSAIYNSAFEAAISTKGWKIHGHTPSDGNCFMWAAASQMNSNKDHAILRDTTADYMDNLPQVSF